MATLKEIKENPEKFIADVLAISNKYDFSFCTMNERKFLDRIKEKFISNGKMLWNNDENMEDTFSELHFYEFQGIDLQELVCKEENQFQRKSIFDREMSEEEAIQLVKFDDNEKSIEDIKIYGCPNTGR